MRFACWVVLVFCSAISHGWAQTGVFSCDSYDRWSIINAEALIADGNAIHAVVADCYDANYSTCAMAHNAYYEAWDELAQVFNGAAAGPNCLNCDIGRLRNAAALLEFQERVLYAKGFRSDIGSIFRTVETWVGTPYCAHVTAGNVPNIAGTYICIAICPAGGVGKQAQIAQNGQYLTFVNEGGQASNGSFISGDTVFAADWGLNGQIRNNATEIAWSNGTIWQKSGAGSARLCSYFNAVYDAGIPGFNQEVAAPVSLEQCQQLCQQRPWCNSVDFERAVQRCFIQPVGQNDQPLKRDYPGNPYDHYSCAN